MRCKLDENLGASVHRRLADAGHDVSTVVLQKMSGAPDVSVFERCAAERRTLVTCDLDFANPFVDIVGYYQVASSGGASQGPAGPTCPAEGCTLFFSANEAFNISPTVPIINNSGCWEMPSNATAFVSLDVPSGAKISAVRVTFGDYDMASRTEYTLQSLDELSAVTMVRSTSFVTPALAFGYNASGNLALNANRPSQGRNNRYRIFIDAYGFGQRFCGAEVSYGF